MKRGGVEVEGLVGNEETLSLAETEGRVEDSPGKLEQAARRARDERDRTAQRTMTRDRIRCLLSYNMD